MELRILQDAEIRATADGKTIEGYAAVFGQRSSDLGGFTEKIQKGCFARAIRSKQDVHCLFNHDAKAILGRTLSGTLQIAEDVNGLRFVCKLPNTTLGNDVREMILRGDVSQCSFGFSAREDAWSRDRTERTLLDVDLFDVSPVTYPAYGGTSVSARGANGNDVTRSGSYTFKRERSVYVPAVLDAELETERRRAKLRIMMLMESEES